MKPFTFLLLFCLPGFLYAQHELVIGLDAGANLISCNLVLSEEFYRENENRGPDPRLMVGQFGAENNANPLYSLINQEGNFYMPRMHFNGIPYWEYEQAYWLMMSRPAQLVWQSQELQPRDADIQIPARHFDENIRHWGGWFGIAYLPDYPLNASASDFRCVENIRDLVKCAVDDQGHFMMPEYNFSNMPPWEPGKGYYIQVNEDAILRYGEDIDEELWQPVESNRFIKPFGSNSLMPVLINRIAGIDPVDGDMITAASQENGTYAGRGTVQDGRCGIVIWKDAIYTQDPDGLENNEEFLLHYWRPDVERNFEVEITRVIEGIDYYYHGEVAVLEITVDPGELLIERSIRLVEGWNLCSMNFIPTQDYFIGDSPGPDLPLLFDQLAGDNGESIISRIVDGMGRFYIPDRNFNQIPYWDFGQGYWIKVTAEANPAWESIPLNPQRQIDLRQGWNVIPFLPAEPIDASAPDFDVLAPIIDHVQIAKDGYGRFMLPELNYSNMPPWEPGRGYLIRVDQAMEFQYPER